MSVFFVLDRKKQNNYLQLTDIRAQACQLRLFLTRIMTTTNKKIDRNKS